LFESDEQRAGLKLDCFQADFVASCCSLFSRLKSAKSFLSFSESVSSSTIATSDFHVSIFSFLTVAHVLLI